MKYARSESTPERVLSCMPPPLLVLHPQSTHDPEITGARQAPIERTSERLQRAEGLL